LALQLHTCVAMTDIDRQTLRRVVGSVTARGVMIASGTALAGYFTGWLTGWVTRGQIDRVVQR
jgi:hypothetical protein